MPPRARTTRTTKSKTVEQKIDALDALRQRATGLDIKLGAERAPLSLGKEEGFDPPLVARYPAKLTGKVQLDMAARHVDTIGMLNVFLGPEQLLRVAQMFEPYPDAERLMAGLALRIAEHMFGPGAGDVPGGTPAS